MVKSKNQKVNHRKKKPMKNKKTIARLNKGSRGVMHWRHRNHKNNKSPWSFKFPETKKAIKKMFGYESEKRVSDSEKERENLRKDKEAHARRRPNSGWGRMTPPDANRRYKVRKDLLRSRNQSLRNVSPEPVSPPPSPELVSHPPPPEEEEEEEDILEETLSPTPPKKAILSGPPTPPMYNRPIDPISLGSPASSLPDFYDTVYIGKESVLTADLIVTVKIKRNTSGSENGLMDLYLIADVSPGKWFDPNAFIRSGINYVKPGLITALDNFRDKNEDIDLKYEFGDKYVKFCLKNIKFNHEIDDKGFVITPDSTLNNLFKSVGKSLGGEEAPSPILKIHVRKGSWKQIKPKVPSGKKFRPKDRSCKSNNCLQVFFYVSTGLPMIGNIDKTFILNESKKHTINDDICSDVEMSKSPDEYMKGTKHNKKKKRTNKKNQKKSKKKKSS